MEKIRDDSSREVILLALIAELFEKAKTTDETKAILSLLSTDFSRKSSIECSP